MNDDVGLRQAGERVERQQAGIAGAGAGQPDMPGLQHRKSAVQGRERVELIHIATRLSPRPPRNRRR